VVIEVIRFNIFLITIIAFWAVASATAANTFHLQQALFDGVGGVDGLDNPRQVAIDKDSKRAYVTSADDNALLILSFESELKPLALFKNSESNHLRLEGASGVQSLKGGESVAVVSFYDNALSTFKLRDGAFYLGENHTEDLGLLGAWDLTVSEFQNRLYVASFKSNAVSAFEINDDANLVFQQSIGKNYGVELGGPVGIDYSNQRNEVIVSGFLGNRINVLRYGEGNKLYVHHKIQRNETNLAALQGPQKVLLSPNERYLYVACSGSDSILVFEFHDNHYRHLQTITHDKIGGAGLKGVGSLDTSPDGSHLFAAGEFDSGLLVFDVMQDGLLQFEQKVQHSEHTIEGVTSITVSADGDNVLLTLGKSDALYWFKTSGE
jgi:6-phosphogluconolactonase (cycloisomerase 2 family)